MPRSGRWRSQYTVNVEERKLIGKILVNVHYYEQGNVSVVVILCLYRLFADVYYQVQLSTTHDISLALPPAITLSSAAPSAAKLFAVIESEESKYQNTLNEAYQEMSEKTFKGLRRALPMTRSKLDWDKVSRILYCCISSCPKIEPLLHNSGSWLQIGR